MKSQGSKVYFLRKHSKQAVNLGFEPLSVSLCALLSFLCHTWTEFKEKSKSGGGFLGYLAVQVLWEIFVEAQTDEEVIRSKRPRNRYVSAPLLGAISYLWEKCLTYSLSGQADPVLELRIPDLKSLIQRPACSWNVHWENKRDGPFDISLQGLDCDSCIFQVLWEQQSAPSGEIRSSHWVRCDLATKQ